ncbi:hypothetical protein Lal_00028681 [Lupinus albus]|uniref:Putative F-box domain-containing protein n=1 Tax=Lupinus albus TaxID=3870 RepID=A0A6A5NBA4_LUPAL|nr:putative F-box domain-containing protein [Lupinus albus]KAF1884794.1 hypothetical protein Lal_00028681 [Lupinus albus]
MSENVPEALVVQILLLLPHRTLVRLCSVSKAWNSLITSHSFISSHLQRSLSNPTPHSLLFIRYSIYTTNKPLWHYAFWSSTDPFPFNRFLKLEPPYQIPHRCSFCFVQSLHGIFCLVEKSLGFDAIDNDITLWNPSIWRYIRLKVPSVKHDALGFGFDSKNNDFKVIIRSFNPDEVKLYSLNEGTWKVLDVSYLQGLGLLKFSNTRCFLNGSVHWITYKANTCPNKNILMFNVEEERFKNMELPPELVKAKLSNLHVSVIEGYLTVLKYHDIHDWDDECDIWMMKEYGVTESWTKNVTIKFPKGVSQLFGPSTSAKVLLLLQENAAERKDGDFISLDSFNQIQEMMEVGIQGYKISAWDYRQSLVLLDKEKQVK